MSLPVILVTGGYDNCIRYWDATSGNCTRTTKFGDSQVNCLQITQDKILLAAAGNPLINIYDINSSDDRPLVSYEGFTSNVTTIGFQKDRRWLYACSEDGTLRVWDPRTNTTSRKYDCGSSVNSVVLHPNETELISGDQNGAVRIWDLQADKCRDGCVPLPDMPVRSISVVSGIMFCLYYHNNAYILSQSLDGSFVTVGSHKGRLFVYNVNANRV
jgi:target of rapamycin complex subunit LST8